MITYFAAWWLLILPLVPIVAHTKGGRPLYKCPYCRATVRKEHITTCVLNPARPQQARSRSSDDAVIEDKEQAENRSLFDILNEKADAEINLPIADADLPIAEADVEMDLPSAEVDAETDLPIAEADVETDLLNADVDAEESKKPAAD